jgi:hypothetical protein
MAINPADTWVFRMIQIQNLEFDLRHGFFAKNFAPTNTHRIVIGSEEIISERDIRPVKCYPGDVVNDYVPFYFAVRTPMLFNIITGLGVPKHSQEDIVYMCCKLTDLTALESQWCFTSGNAAKKITRFYTDLADLNNLDWHSIKSTDFRHVNADGDEDRVRKKHAEFLVKQNVPADKISGIAVLNPAVKKQVETIVLDCNLAIEVKVKRNFYFP